jgi:hypothetical protein
MRQRESDYGLGRVLGPFAELLQKLRFASFGIDSHFAGSNLFFRCALKTEFTNTQAAFGADGRSEGSAGERPRSVEIAQAGGWIESRARFVVGEIFEAGEGVGIVVERSRDWVSGEACGEARDTLASALTNSLRASRITAFQFDKSVLKAKSVERADGEYADAALRAPGTTDEPVSTAARRVGKSGIDDLHELPITGGKRAHRSQG